MPPYFGRLTNLQSLSAFIVGNKEENGISQINDMDLLRGSLCIKNIEVVNVGDVTQAKLHNKAFLDKLELQWVPLTSGAQQDTLQQTQNQQDMPRLESMDDSFYGTIDGVKFPSLVLFEVRRMTRLISWVYTATFASMPRLNIFTVHDCPNLTSIPANLMSRDNSNISDCSNLLITTLPSI